MSLASTSLWLLGWEGSDASIRDMVFGEIKQYHNPIGKPKQRR